MLTHKGTKLIETHRLILRPALPEDAQPMFENWASDPEVTKFLTWPPHRSIDVSAAVIQSWIDGYSRDDYYQWMICLKEDTHSPIGSVSVVELNDTIQKAEIGYCIGKNWWRKGIMTEALMAVIDFLFNEVGMQRIEARHDPRNPNSGAVMQKCRMKFEGTTRQSDRNNLGICDAAHYSILRHEHSAPKHIIDDARHLNDESLVQTFYSRLPEVSRLTASKAARVEFVTTVRYIEKYLSPGAKILDIGAGSGEYSLYFSRKGYDVSALELADANIDAFRARITDKDRIDLVKGNAIDLSRYPDDCFDIVLLLGPLYHLHREEDRLRCIEEAKRVCRKDGKIFFAFIANDIVILTMQQEHSEYLLEGDYNKETFRLDDFPFVFHTPDHARQLLRKADVQLCHEVAADGLSELLKDMINRMDDASFDQYLRYHYHICEKPENLGMSNHLLFVGQK